MTWSRCASCHAPTQRRRGISRDHQHHDVLDASTLPFGTSQSISSIMLSSCISPSRQSSIRACQRLASWSGTTRVSSLVTSNHYQQQEQEHHAVDTLVSLAKSRCCVTRNYVTRAHLMGHLRECQDGIAERLLSFRKGVVASLSDAA